MLTFVTFAMLKPGCWAIAAMMATLTSSVRPSAGTAGCRYGSCSGGLGSLGLREDLAHQHRQEDDAGKAHKRDAHTHDNNKCAGNLHRRIRSFYVFWRYYSAQNLHINRLEALLASA